MKHGIGLGQAFRTLSIIPFPGKDASSPSKSLVFYPFVGIILGFLSILIPYYAIELYSDNLMYLLCGTLYAGIMAFLTRAFHLDGLGDMADGFGSSWDKNRILEVMSDSRSGTFSVVSICLVIILKTVSSALIFSRNMFVYIVFAVMISRSFTVFACCIGRYAKSDGLSYKLVSETTFSQFVIVLVFDIAVFGIAAILGIIRIKKIIFAFSLSSVSLLLLMLKSYKKIQGITGDVLGACTEITETVALVSFCFF